ncbi:MAG: hypothetical protein J0H52_13255 [Comamonadaceae bacterium]|jgi:hypothetical protein|nr:hypothetical protein [Comamonadaceae bacterium]MBN9369014.1 hypothetical protein [Comamonadaceae bacterium]
MPNFGDLFGGSNIKSIQSGVIELGLHVNQQSVAITPVNPAWAVPSLLGVFGILTSVSGDLIPSNGYVQLTGGGTSMTAFAPSEGYAYSRRFSWVLVEYYPS